MKPGKKTDHRKQTAEEVKTPAEEIIWEDEYFSAVLKKDGICLSSKTEEAAAGLAELMKKGQVENHYQAVLSGFMPESEGELTGKDSGGSKITVDYEVLDELDTDEGPLSLVLFLAGPDQADIIRSFAASAGVRVKKGGLFSTRITFVHPFTGEEVFLHREPEGKVFDLMDQMDW